MRKKLGSLAVTAAVTTATALTLLAPLTASASVAPHHTVDCPTGRVKSMFNEVSITTGPKSSSTIGVLQKGDQINCVRNRQPDVGLHYDVCGGGNGYIAVYHNEGGDELVRYTYEACMADVSR